MNEERDSQLSAMFDGELPEGECELLARRLGREAVLRSQWARYALAGAALRAEPGMRLDLSVARRVSAALAAEPPLGAAASSEAALRTLVERRAGHARWLRPAAGAAVAASVAALSILYLRAQAPESDDPLVARTVAPASAPAVVGAGPALASAGREAAPAGSEPESYIVPVAAGDQGAPIAAAELANYVVAHSEFSSPLVRRNLLTTLVTSDTRAAREPERSGAAPAGPEARE